MTQPAPNTARQIGYASGNFGKAVFLGSLDITLMFLMTDIFGYAPALAGTILFVALIWDAVHDVSVGWLVERFQFGRYRYGPWIITGAVASAPLFLFLFALPILGVDGVTILITALLALRLAISVADIPHTALITHVEKDSGKRNNVAIYRFAFSGVGFLLISSIIPLITAADNEMIVFRGFLLLGLIGGSLGGASVLFSWYVVRTYDERFELSAAKETPLSLRSLPKLASRDVLIVLAIILLNPFAIGLFSKTLIYQATYVMGDGARAALLLNTLIAGQYVGMIGWLKFSKKFEKARVLQLSYALSLVSLVIVYLAAPSSLIITILAVFCLGIGSSAGFTFVWSMLADCMDSAHHRIKGSVNALGFGFAIMASKAAAGVSALFIGAALSGAGYIAGVEQSAEAVTVIRGLNALVPAFFCALCIIVLRWYNLTYKRHEILTENS